MVEDRTKSVPKKKAKKGAAAGEPTEEERMEPVHDEQADRDETVETRKKKKKSKKHKKEKSRSRESSPPRQTISKGSNLFYSTSYICFLCHL